MASDKDRAEIKRLIEDAEPNISLYPVSSSVQLVAQLCVRYATLKWQMGTQAQMNTLMRALLTYRNVVEEVWGTPTVTDCERFILQELGELSSANMRLGVQDLDHFRSTPTPEDVNYRVRAARTELGQLLMMVLTMHELMNVHPEETLALALNRTTDKLTSRGKLTGAQAQQAGFASGLLDSDGLVEDPRSYCKASYATFITMDTDSKGGDGS
jgi:hypothetical protein